MSKKTHSRRKFLVGGSLGVLGAALHVEIQAQTPAGQLPNGQPETPGAPSAFGTAPPVGPEVSPATFAEAEKLMQVEMTAADRTIAASNWRMQMAPLYERRTGPKKITLEPTLAPASQWNPMLPGMQKPHAESVFVRSESTAPLPAKGEDIAFAPVWQLSRFADLM